VVVGLAGATGAVALVRCGKQEAAVLSGDGGDNAVIVLARDQIETPFFLALSKPIPGNELDKNDQSIHWAP
jgi:hypothetical protein